MKWLLEPVTGPDIEPVDLARMKRELGEFASVTENDTDITAKIQAAREWVEDYCGVALIDQSWRLTIDQTGALALSGSVYRCGTAGSTLREIHLRRSPVLAITSIATVDADGVETIVDPATYQLREGDSKWPRVVPVGAAAWQNSNLRIVFRAGFADLSVSPPEDASDVPERFKQAVILWVKGNYDGDKDADVAAERLLRPLRCHLGFS